MRLYQVLLATVVAFLVSNNVFTAAKETKLALTGISWSTRSLRVEKFGNDIDASSPEERGFFSDLKKKINVIRWIGSGKSNDYVLAKLNLKGLSGAALKSHKNYKFYQSFLKKALANQLNTWLVEGKTTSSIWTTLGLHKVPVDDLAKIKEFETYVQYVKLFDKDSMRKWGAYKLPEMVGSSGTGMIVKTRIWAQTRISAKAKEVKKFDVYVKMALGMEGLSENAIKTSRNYKYYESYVKELKSLGS